MIEKFASDKGKPLSKIKTVIHAFHYDISNEDDFKMWEKIRSSALKQGIELMECISMKKGYYRGDYSPEEITLETDFLFNNQWNSEEFGRVFDYYSEIVPNEIIKAGHWLEITQEMKDIRDNTFKCGYCGAEYYGKHNKGRFCEKCIDSEYLTKDYLHLLKVLPVSSKKEARELSESEYNFLMPIYINAQTRAHQERSLERTEKEFERAKKEWEKDFANAENKQIGFTWLYNNGVSLSNVIYYDHVQTFSFGWRHELDFEVAQELRVILESFPCKWEMKTKDLGKIESGDL